MKGRIDWNLLAKHLRGECSDEEVAALRAWLQGQPARKALQDEWPPIWQTMDRSSSQSDVEALWSRVQAHIRQAAKTESLQAPARRPASRPPGSRRRRPSHSTTWPLRLAGVMVLVAVMAFLVVQMQRQPRALKIFVTQRGQQATLQLTDGTHVRLNVDSKLTLLPTFGADAREVRLQGEAYFDVAEDTNRPFIVHAGGTAIRVLGTAFDVNAYHGGKGVQVVVAEGRVSFHRGQTSPQKRVVLTERQMGQLLRSGESVVLDEVDLSRHLAWMEGRLVFVDAPFDEVTRKLERWYALEVVVTDSSLVRGHLNARFTDRQPLREILSVIAVACGLRYEREGKTVTFFPHGV